MKMRHPLDPKDKLIQELQKLIGLPNICGSIDEIHIPFIDLPSKRVTLAQSDFFNNKKFHNIVLQNACGVNKQFWNVCVRQPGGVHDGGQFKVFNLYKQLRD
jgi:hypothetical protein